MSKTTTKLIDGQKYECGFWPLEKQLEIMTKLIRLFGEPFANFIMGGAEKKSVTDMMAKEIDGNTFGKAVGVLASRLNEDEVKYLLRSCTEGVLCNSKPIVYDIHFMGRVGHLLKVAMFCIRHQYSDFLGVVPGLGEGPGAATSQKASI